jgi:hypothetical protein
LALDPQIWDYGFKALYGVGIAVAAIKSWTTASVARELHISLNSRLTQLLATKDRELVAAVEAAAATAMAVGLKQGREEKGTT